MAINIFGQQIPDADSGSYTPESLKLRRALAQAQFEKGIDVSPIQSPWQGLARMANAMLGGYDVYDAEQKENASAEKSAKVYEGMIGGAPSAPATTGAPALPTAKTPYGGVTAPGTTQAPDLGEPTPRFSPDIDKVINDAAVKAGVNPDTLRRFAKIESGGNPSSRTGSYQGLFQLSPEEFAKYGGQGNILDPAANANAAALKLKAEAAAFEQKAGRAPTDAELYMIHQQGTAGAGNHYAYPDRPAWLNMLATPEGQQKGAAWAKQAIWGNIPYNLRAQFGSVDNVSSKQFTDMWASKVGNRAGAPDAVSATAPDVESPFGTVTAPGSTQEPQISPQAGGISAATPTAAQLNSALPSANVANPLNLSPQAQATFRRMFQAGGEERKKAVAAIQQLIIDNAKQDIGTTNETKEYGLAVKQAQAQGKPIPDFTTWLRENKQAGAIQFHNTQNQESKYSHDRGQNLAKHEDEMNVAANKAFENIGNINLMREAMKDPNFRSGILSGTNLAFNQVIAAIGGDPTKAASMETFRSLASKSILSDIGGSLGTGISNADRDFISQSAPNLANTDAGNEMLLDIKERVERRKIAIADFADQYREAHGGMLDDKFAGALRKWGRENPMFTPEELQRKPLAGSPGAKKQEDDTYTEIDGVKIRKSR